MHCSYHFNFATMNNQKPTQPFNVNSTQAGVATHIVYNNGTLNFSRYLDPAMTPPDGIHNDTIIDNTEGIQANLSFRNLNDNTANDNLTSAVNTASLNLVPNNQMTTNSDNLSNDKNTQNGFRTANGHEITPKLNSINLTFYRYLQHERFYAKSCDMSQRVVYATRRMSYIYCM